MLLVLYLIFNEGHTASSGPDLVRADLASEAIRLARQARRLLPDEGEVAGLLALMLLTDARRPARTGPAGELVPLAEQDRTRWDAGLIREGIALITDTLSWAELGPYQLQAAIAAVHAEAREADDTDWPQILALYELLERIAPSPVVTLNRAVARAMVDGPHAALALLETLDADERMAEQHRLHAVRAHLLELAGEEEAHARASSSPRSAPRACPSSATSRAVRRACEALGRCDRPTEEPRDDGQTGPSHPLPADDTARSLTHVDPTMTRSPTSRSPVTRTRPADGRGHRRPVHADRHARPPGRRSSAAPARLRGDVPAARERDRAHVPRRVVAHPPGNTANIAANAPHSLRNVSNQVVRMLCTCSPAGQDEFVLAVGDRVASRTSPPPALDAAGVAERIARARRLAPRYRTELLGP